MINQIIDKSSYLTLVIIAATVMFAASLFGTVVGVAATYYWR